MEKKKCTICGSEKLLTEFNTRGRGRLHNYCKPCQHEYSKQHYRNNKEKYAQVRFKNHGIYRQRNRELVDSLKDKPCMDCGGEFHPFIMEFDHVRGKKKFGIAKAVNMALRIQTILEEVEKCDLVCSNCHRMRTLSRDKKLQR